MAKSHKILFLSFPSFSQLFLIQDIFVKLKSTFKDVTKLLLQPN